MSITYHSTTILGTPVPGSPATDPNNGQEDNQQEGESSSMIIAIAAGISGGIVVLVMLLAISICVICLSRRVQVHIHYGDKTQESQKQHPSHDKTNSNEIPVQLNTAYSQVNNDKQIRTMNRVAAGRNLKQGHTSTEGERRSCDQRQGHNIDGTTARNIMYHHGNNEVLFPIQQGHFIMMTQQNESYPDEDYTYEYIQ